ncbi:MAG: response regulator [Flavobacterium sp.]|nr:response regulator [Flavobacterium sp.]
MAIAKKNADLLEFELKLESEFGIGTTISITKTNITEEKNIENEESQTKNSSDERKVILIAEDGEVNYLILKKLINKLFDNRFEIIRAINGEAAVYYCKIEANKVDLVLMDIKMPIMDGYEATRKIKDLRPTLPIIAQTAFSSANDIEQAKKSGCDDFIEKPIDQNLLGIVISKYLN